MRLFLLVPASLVAALLFGCEKAPQFDPTTKYTPESLAQELSLRYRGLSDRAKKAPLKSPKVRVDKDAELKSLADDATKSAPDATLDAVLDDIGRKTSLIEGKSRPEVCKAMVEALAHDKTLKPKDVQTLKDGLERITQGS